MEPALHPALVQDGRFEVTRCLGTGGFGAVYAVYDKRTDAHVALKWLRNSDAATIARFKREFRSLADLAHPNLVSFRELITVAGEWFFTMDLVEGVELLHWVRPASPQETLPTGSASVSDPLGSTVALRGPNSPGLPRSSTDFEPILDATNRPLSSADLPRVRSTLEQLVTGLSALHGAGMLHRDVKPSNVLVTREGRVVLLDFGLVTEMGTDGVAKTITGNVVGTPAYMSPEQAMGSSVGPPSDFYSVGAVLYQALTGKPPFEGDPHAVLIKKQLADAIPPHEVVRGVPRALSDLCVDLLARAPERRPDGAAILERLAAALPYNTGSMPPGAVSQPSGGVAQATGGSVDRTVSFVGRETHLWALEEASEESEHGKTVVALVHGGSGMGKSALVRHFLDRVRAERPETVILEGRCYERESMPYKALDSLVDSLCRYLQRLSDVEAAKLLPRDLSALARVFPVFLQFDVGAARRPRAKSDVVQERRRAFDALRELLARVADRNPAILFIDDLQWGDGDSEPLLTALFRPPDPPPLLLIAAYRAEDAATAPLVRALHKLASSGPSIEVCEVPVGELSPDAARDLASSLLGDGAERSRAEGLARESFGSPLFLRQLAALGATAEHVDLASALAARIKALAEEPRRLLETLAVSGKPLPLTTAARAAGIEHDAQGVLATLRSETLVRTRGVEARDEVEIYHDKIREAVVASLSEEEQQARHRKLARALSSAGEGDAEDLATHFLAGGERALAAQYAEQAAERASGALAFARAAQMYEMAIEVGSTLGRDATDLRLKLAEALVAAGRGYDAAMRFVQLARRASAADGLELRRRAAEQLLFCGHIDEGLRVVDQILSAMKMRMPKTPFGAVVSLLWRRFLLKVRGLGFRERNADQLARDRLVRIDTCYSVALGLGMVDPIRGADFQTRYLLLALAAGEPVRIAKGLALEAAYRAADGSKARRAIESLLARAREIADRVGQAHASALVTLMSGVARVILGDFPAAVPLCDRAATELREKCTGVAWELDNAAFFAGFSLGQCGRVKELAERMPTLIDDARSRGDLYGEVFLRLQCAWLVALANDDVAGAEAELEVLTEDWSRDRFLLQHVWRMVNAIEVALYAGDPAKAEAHVEETWPKLEKSLFLRAESARARVHNAVGRAALAAAFAAKDDATRDARAATAEKSAQALAREGWPLAAGFALLLEAGVSAVRGRGDRAAELYAKAAAALDEKGARLYAMAARYRRGELVGGDEGDALVQAAEKEMGEERIRVPAKMARVYAPGPLAAEAPLLSAGAPASSSSA